MISLNIAIPTYERNTLLVECLESIREALNHSPETLLVRVSIFDNSLSNTPEDLLSYISGLYWCSYQRNKENIGSDRNILQCLSLKTSQYIMVLGDDDRLMPDALVHIAKLLNYRPDILVLKAFGFSKDYLKEHPRLSNTTKYKFFSSDRKRQFLSVSTPAHTFISSQIFSTELFKEDELTKFLCTNLIQVGAFAISVSRGKKFITSLNYTVAGMRENSGGYNSKKVFVDNFDNVWRGFCDGNTLCKSVYGSMVSYSLPAQFLRASNDVKVEFLDFENYPENYKKTNSFVFFKLVASLPLIVHRFIFLLWIVVAKILRRDFSFVYRYIRAKYFK